MVTRLKEAAPITPGVGNIPATFQQWATAQLEMKVLGNRVSQLKERLLRAVEAHGFVDDKQHGWFEFQRPITINGDRFVSLCRQRRVSTVVDHDKVEVLLRDKGLWFDETAEKRIASLRKAYPHLVIEVSPDMETVEHSVFKGVITEDEFESCVSRKETYAFVPTKEK